MMDIPDMHELKTWGDAFDPLWNGEKGFEFRKNDRGFKVGASLLLKEWNPVTEEMKNGEHSPKDGIYPNGYYTGRVILADVLYILPAGKYGVPEGYCVMQLVTIRRMVMKVPLDLQGWVLGNWSAGTGEL
jgi:hypothetical protein